MTSRPADGASDRKNPGLHRALVTSSVGLLGATLLLAFNDAWWPLAAYVVLLSLITFVTTFVTPETRGRDLTDLADAR